MINGKRIAVVLPAYNAEKTLEMTVRELSDVVDIKILVDDSSKDQTARLSRQLGLHTFIHNANYGYGRNQQTCYREALTAGADIVVMLHPDYQYTPLLVPAMAGMIASGVYDMVLASRILGGGALKGGMPVLQIHFESVAHCFSEHVSRRETLGIPYRLSRLFKGAAGGAPDPRELFRLRFRQPDGCSGCYVRISDRRDLLPDEVLRRGIIHQFQAQCAVWSRCSWHYPRVCCA